MKKIALILLLAVAGLTACQQSTLELVDPTINEDAISLPLNLAVKGMTAGTDEAKEDSYDYYTTKSVIGEDEPLTEIQNLWILQFSTSNKRIVNEPQYIANYPKALADGDNIALVIPSGEEMQTLVYVANTFNGALTSQLGSDFTIDEFKALTYDITDEQSNFKGYDATGKYYCVLYGEKTQEINSAGLEKCTLIRNVAKINVKIEVKDGVDLVFHRAIVRGVPAISSYCPNIVTGKNYPADDSFHYIHYDGEDIYDQTDTLTFYVPVNLRGTSSSDTGSMKNHYGTAYHTSISLAAYSDTKGYLYTFFLGSNLIDDYNIAPNTEYTYTLKFNTVGDPKSDLRVEEAGGEDFSLPTMPRSNCYILDPSPIINSEFIIPIDRIDEFWGNEVHYNTAKVQGNTLEEVGDNWEAVILWHDCNGDQQYDAATDQIGGLKLEENYNDNTIKVTLPSEFTIPTNHCNVVFVVRKKDGNKDILWSWHLWITDYNPYEDRLIPSLNAYKYEVSGGYLHRYNNTIFTTGVYGQKFIMDRNIGARSAKIDGYGIFEKKFIGPGTLYYQYGRFSPYPAYGYTYCNGYEITKHSGQVSFAEAVQLPYAYISTSGNWCNEKDSGSTDYIWNDYQINSLSYNNDKSIFDPSPMGFHVPVDGTWAGFKGGPASDEFSNPTGYPFKLVNNVEGVAVPSYSRIYNDFAFYPASGIYNSFGNINSIGEKGGAWSASPSSSTHGYVLNFGETYANVSQQATRADAYPVRPIQE